MNDTAAILLNYQSWGSTLEEIELLHEKENIAYRDMIVIDNHSPNESAEKLERGAQEKGYTFLQAPENRGYASGNNLGLRAAAARGYRYALILNNDILFTDNETVQKLRRVFQKEQRAAVVNPDISSPEGYLYNRDACRPSFWDMTLGMYHYRKKGRELQDLGGYGYIYRPQGCCMMLDMDKLQEVNFLDEHTFLYVEESILAERLAQKGYVCVCCTDCCVVHNHSRTVSSVLQRREIRRIHNSSFAYYLKVYRGFGCLRRTVCLLFHTVKMILWE